MLRLASVIENDIAVLETGHRGFLLTGDPSYVEPFERRRDLLKRRVDDLTVLILDSPRQRKRVMKIQEIVQKWLETIALPQMTARQSKGAGGPAAAAGNSGVSLGNTFLNEAREILQSLQNEEQIVLHQRMQDQEWAAQSTQVLDLLKKLERSLIEMQKEKRGYLLTGDNGFADAYKRATTDFLTYHGYLSILIANSPEQAESLADIRKRVERWAAAAALPEMEAKRTGKDVTALLGNNKGDEAMAEIREMLSAFEKNEVSRYEARSNAATRERIIKTIRAGDSVCLRGRTAHCFKQLQLRAGPPAVGQTGRRRDAHPLHHREHPRRHDHRR